MEPRDELFATLDVTAHRGTLPNGMAVIFLDTVGFIQNLPHDLVASFSATLQDVLLADVIIHIRDISHTDTVSQKVNVLRVLGEIGLPNSLMSGIIEVCNKSDKLTDGGESVHSGIDTIFQKINIVRALGEIGLPDRPMSGVIVVCDKRDKLTDRGSPDSYSHLISATQGLGLEELKLAIQDQVLTVTDTVACTLRIPMSGQHLQWLYKEATVKSQHSLEGDTEFMLVDVVMSLKTKAKFRAKFGGNFLYHEG